MAKLIKSDTDHTPYKIIEDVTNNPKLWRDMVGWFDRFYLNEKQTQCVIMIPKGFSYYMILTEGGTQEKIALQKLERLRMKKAFEVRNE